MTFIVKTSGFDNWTGPDGAMNIKVLLTGESGTAKTPTAACWPKPFFAACEPGMASIASKSIPYGDVKCVADMEAALDLMRRNCLRPAPSREYQTLVIDTFDSYQKTIILERLRNERKDSLSGWSDWGWLDGKMSQLVERINNLPMNVLVLLHTKDVQDGDGDDSILVKKARLKGDIKDTLFQDFDLIGQAEKSYVAEEGERVLKRQIRWHSEPKFPFIRDRFNVLPKFTDITFTEDDYLQIYNPILANVDSLPESTVIETIETEGVTPATADEQGGPVEEPKLPPAKKAAASRTAKKAAANAAVKEEAKEAAANPAAEVVNPEPEAPPEKEVEQPADAPADESGAVDYVAQELGAETIAEEPAAPVAEAPKEAPKPEEKKAEEKEPLACGSQPPGMVGKFEPADHCGLVLTKENASRFQMALLKTKTYLCDACLDKHQAA